MHLDRHTVGRTPISLACVALVYALVLLGCSSTGTATGLVTNALDKTAIPGVTVTVSGTTLAATSDEAGAYEIGEIVPGPQTFVASKDGFLALGAPVVATMAAGTEVELAPFSLFPMPPSSGLHVLDGGTFVPVAQRTDYDSYMMKSGLFWTHASARRQPFPTLPSACTLILMVPTGSPPEGPEGIFVRKLGQGQAYERNTRVPVWLFETSGGKNEPIARVNLREDLAQLTYTLAPGNYVLARSHPFGVKDWYYPFNVAAPPAAPATLVDGPPGGRLVAETGEYASGSQQWRTARDMVVAWCGQASPDPACATALPDLKKEPEAGGNERCVGRLLIENRSARFSTWECGAGIQVDLAKNEDGWSVNTLTYVPEIDEEYGD